MNIRQATLEDTGILATLNAEVQQLHHECYPDLFTSPDTEEVKAWFEELLEDTNTVILLAQQGEEIIGYIAIRRQIRPPYIFINERRCAYIDQVCITQKHRKSGIFQKFLEEGIKLCREWKVDKIELDVWAKNDAAIESFRKNGFQTYNQKMEMQIPPE